MASLYSACKSAIRLDSSGTYDVGGYDIGLELYHQSDIDNGTTLGDNRGDKIVVIADETITIPSGYTLTPNSPKKSLVIICNTLVNNGTISMYQKAPQVTPHDFYIISKDDGVSADITIPAYANNQITTLYGENDSPNGDNGNNGSGRNCGSGGTGTCSHNYTTNASISGSGCAFGGGAGSGASGGGVPSISVLTSLPMSGSDGINPADPIFSIEDVYGGLPVVYQGGVGIPSGNTYSSAPSTYSNLQNTGCGGRVIIFCINFKNNGLINVNGTPTLSIKDSGASVGEPIGGGGASGAGAVDVFYKNLLARGSITAEGGGTYTYTGALGTMTPGKGGNGSITLTQWNLTRVMREEAKFFSQASVDYLLSQLAERIKDSRMGE